MVSDRGPQFTSQIMSSLCESWGVMQKLSTAYHPQTNMTERVNRTMKTMIASFVEQHHQCWDRWLPEFRLAINSATHETTGVYIYIYIYIYFTTIPNTAKVLYVQKRETYNPKWDTITVCHI